MLKITVQMFSEKHLDRHRRQQMPFSPFIVLTDLELTM